MPVLQLQKSEAHRGKHPTSPWRGSRGQIFPQGFSWEKKIHTGSPSWHGCECCHRPVVLAAGLSLQPAQGSLVPQVPAALWGKLVPTSLGHPEHGSFCGLSPNPRIQAPLQKKPVKFKGRQEIDCNQCLSMYPLRTCLGFAPGCPKDLHRIKWKMYGEAENWGRNPKSGQKFWSLNLPFGFHYQSSVDLQPGRDECPW